jgi:hypothetical protein
LLAVRIDCRLSPLGSFIAIRCINSGAFFYLLSVLLLAFG